MSADRLRFLTQSDNRPEALAALREAGPLDRDGIAARLDASRRTVVRTVEALTDEGYVEQVGERYRLTALGATVIAAYQRLADEVALTDRLEPLLANVPGAVFDFDPRLLADAELVVATEGSPYALLDRTLTLRREARRVREIAPMTEKRSIEQLADRIRGGADIEFDAILSAATLEASRSNPEYADAFETTAASDAVDVAVYPDEVELFLCVADDTVAVGASKDDRPHAMVVTSNPRVREWAIDTFEDHWDRAEPVA
jgi:predicted transcriptional regulator